MNLTPEQKALKVALSTLRKLAKGGAPVAAFWPSMAAEAVRKIEILTAPSKLAQLEAAQEVPNIPAQTGIDQKAQGANVLTLTELEQIASACMGVDTFNFLMARVLDHLGAARVDPGAEYARAHRSTAPSCPECCAKVGEPHVEGCNAAAFDKDNTEGREK